jgi:hypothetical protein
VSNSQGQFSWQPNDFATDLPLKDGEHDRSGSRAASPAKGWRGGSAPVKPPSQRAAGISATGQSGPASRRASSAGFLLTCCAMPEAMRWPTPDTTPGLSASLSQSQEHSAHGALHRTLVNGSRTFGAKSFPKSLTQ